ncbi:MAG: L-threonylcarbamoyladenylate synthase [Solirubrobacteraceae bacterium]|nr:L-threonylcarbamoyladenylate synthase [Solirubrobacteraceae bacterium]
MERVTYDDLEPLVRALHEGHTVAIPTDTVYGVACAAHLPDACERLLRAKGRPPAQPTAIVGGTVESALDVVLPELPAAARERARRLLPGPVTLILPNPGRRYAWLCGDEPERIGLRVPELHPQLAAAIDRVGALLLTSANRAGEPPARAFEDLEAVAAIAHVALDGGTCPGGAPSTVVDVCGDDPVIVREGPVSLDELRARLA